MGKSSVLLGFICFGLVSSFEGWGSLDVGIWLWECDAGCLFGVFLTFSGGEEDSSMLEGVDQLD